jgi:ATP-binding cassette subfamily B (MDR/TAP) protein 1
VEIMSVIERKPAIDSMSLDGFQPSEEISGSIELRDVTFVYPSREDTSVLSSFNLSIASGEYVALVGPSGSGKSTIVSLILRHYDPCSGSVLLDGRDLRDFNVRWLRSKIGYV